MSNHIHLVIGISRRDLTTSDETKNIPHMTLFTYRSSLIPLIFTVSPSPLFNFDTLLHNYCTKKLQNKTFYTNFEFANRS